VTASSLGTGPTTVNKRQGLIRAVVPNRGAIYDTQGCRELMRFSIYH